MVHDNGLNVGMESGPAAFIAYGDHDGFLPTAFAMRNLPTHLNLSLGVLSEEPIYSPEPNLT